MPRQFFANLPWLHLKGIAFESPEVRLRKLRERLRLMSDEELVKFGKMVRGLSEPRVSVMPDPWKEQLQEARASGGAGILFSRC